MRTARGAGGARRGVGGRAWVAGGVALLLLAAASEAAGQGLEQYDYANLGLRAVGVDVFWVESSQNEGTAAFGLRADLGFLGPYVRVVPRFLFWSADVEGAEVEELESRVAEAAGLPAGSVELGRIERDAWVLGMDVQWTMPTWRVAPYIGMGVDAYILDDSGNVIEDTFLDDAVVTAGLSAVGGLEARVSRGWMVYGEIRGTLVTDATNVAVGGGLAYRFGGP